jgi:copper(I)-binding protein
MKRLSHLAACALLAGCSASAPEIEAREGWVRETAPGTSMAAVYMIVANRGGGDDRLVGVETPRGTAELHVSQIANGIASMRAVEGLPVPAGGELRLAPGGAHLMVTGLDAPLKVGERFPVTLRFDRSEPQSLTIHVLQAGTSDHGGH